ncbi:MAG: hypothetical protein RJA07_1715 [Bacteroidota bacterium]|jgi:hypothetical protein
MKKHLLFLLFCLVDLSAFCQSNKINKQDSVASDFSTESGWALKINALQPFTIGEFRLGTEKRISPKTSIEFFGSYYIPSLQFFYALGGRGDLNSGKYFGKNNFKIGTGCLIEVPSIKRTYIEVLGFYHYLEDTKDFSNSSLNFQQLIKGYNFAGKNKIFCFQILGVNRLERGNIFFDIYFGFGLRGRSSEIIMNSASTIPTLIYDGNLPYEYYRAGNVLIRKMFMYSLQCGVNIGIQSK